MPIPNRSTDALSHRALVGDALDVVFDMLRPYVEERMREAYGDNWLRESRNALRGKPPERWDASDLLTLIYFKYAQAFRSMGHDGRSWVSLLKEVRKKWAHQVDLSIEETRRALETTLLLLRTIGADAEADRLEPRVLALMQEELAAKLADDAPGGGRRLLERGLSQVRTLWAADRADPLELRARLLDAVEAALEPHRHHLAFSGVVVHVVAEADRLRDRYEMAFQARREPFEAAVRRRLAEARMDLPGAARIAWKLHQRAPKRFAGQFDEGVYVELRKRRAQTTATLAVVDGQAREPHYVITSDADLTIGRVPEVMDSRGRLVRRNAVSLVDDAALDPDDIARHHTVSRAHARIRYDSASGTFQVVDDQSTSGTTIVRPGAVVPIQVSRQPVSLRDGDLLHCGKVAFRFTLGRPAKSGRKRSRSTSSS